MKAEAHRLAQPRPSELQLLMQHHARLNTNVLTDPDARAKQLAALELKFDVLGQKYHPLLHFLCDQNILDELHELER